MFDGQGSALPLESFVRVKTLHFDSGLCILYEYLNDYWVYFTIDHILGLHLLHSLVIEK